MELRKFLRNSGIGVSMSGMVLNFEFRRESNEMGACKFFKIKIYCYFYDGFVQIVAISGLVTYGFVIQIVHLELWVLFYLMYYLNGKNFFKFY